MNNPAASGRGISLGIIFHSPQVAGNKTQEILRLRSGSVRLINPSSLSFLESKSHRFKKTMLALEKQIKKQD